ncbi:NINJ1 [Branchiostoma lanceolatum]|uniref:NINJ1 protein n=1 Tax=Branchiostoma lanceolatum TaxID=7740 RepID=A0A8K0AB98_BRALA|nr:NINJ1 [Branchiostoma lanceolatum]
MTRHNSQSETHTLKDQKDYRLYTPPRTKKTSETSGNMSEIRPRNPGGSQPDKNPETSPATRGKIKDLDKFNQHQTLSHGSLNVSLLSANASQLMALLRSGYTGPLQYIQLTLLVSSVVLQVVQGILLLRKYQIKMETAHDNDDSDDEEDNKRAHKFNDWAMMVSFVIGVVNILILTFGTSVGPVPSASKPKFKPV